MTHRMRGPRALVLIALALSVGLGAAACAAAEDGAKTSAGAPALAPGGGADNAAKDAAGGGMAGDAGSQYSGAKPEEGKPQEGAPEAGEPNRAIIYTGTITLQVTDVAGVADKVSALATGARGYLGADQRSLTSGPDAHAELVLQVPSNAFGSTLDAIGKLGKELDRATKTEDVTEAVIDLDTRIASQQASVTRTRALMAKANTIAEIVSVESELTKRESELASLQARKRQLAGQVAYSTITVMLQREKTVEVLPKPEEPESGFLTGLKDGWHAFVVTVQALLTVFGALLPFIIVIGVPTWVYFWLKRRRSAPRPAPASPPAQAVEEADDLAGKAD